MMNINKLGQVLVTSLALAPSACALEPLADENTVYMVEDGLDRCGDFAEDVALQNGEVGVRLKQYSTFETTDMVVVKNAEEIKQACERLLNEASPSRYLHIDMVFCNSVGVDANGNFITEDFNGRTVNSAMAEPMGITLRCKDILNGNIEIPADMTYTSPGNEFYYRPADMPGQPSGITKSGDKFQNICTFPKYCPSTPIPYHCDFWDEDGIDYSRGDKDTVLTESEWKQIENSGKCSAIASD